MPLNIAIKIEANKAAAKAQLTCGEPVATKVPFKIGQRNSSEFLKGELSDFRLYDRELSDKEVKAVVSAATF